MILSDLDKQIMIVGSGGHAKVVADMVKLSGYKLLGFTTPDLKSGTKFCDNLVLGRDSVIKNYSVDEVKLVNGVGSMPRQDVRRKLASTMREKGYSFITVVHPRAVIALDVELSEGVQVMAGAVIQSGAKIGQDSIINTGSLIDHDCEIGANCHLAPGVTCSGNVNIGQGVHVGTGSSIIQGISIGKNSVIAAGSVIFHDVPDNVTVMQYKDTKYIKK